MILFDSGLAGAPPPLRTIDYTTDPGGGILTSYPTLYRVWVPLYIYLSELLVMLPALTYFGDFQPITHSIMTSSFFFVTIMEVNSYLYRLKNTYKLDQDIAELYGLTNRENEIVLQIIKGFSYKKIAENMFISYGTVRKHASNTFSKCKCSSREQLIDKVNK